MKLELIISMKQTNPQSWLTIRESRTEGKEYNLIAFVPSINSYYYYSKLKLIMMRL